MKILKILFNTFTCISIITIILSIIYLFPIIIQNKGYGNILGYSIFQIKSGSMEPTINIGDFVITKTDTTFQEGDIIIYQEKNHFFICHRVNKIIGNSVICKGDNNNTIDIEISNENIVGKVIKIL